jgi:predicted dehydrogenase
VNIVVIGLGSMGKRRIRLLRQIQPHFNILGVDLNKERRFEVQDKYSVKTLDQLNNEEADVAFVCTSPLSHGDIIRTCLKKICMYLRKSTL